MELIEFHLLESRWRNKRTAKSYGAQRTNWKLPEIATKQMPVQNSSSETEWCNNWQRRNFIPVCEKESVWFKYNWSIIKWLHKQMRKKEQQQERRSEKKANAQNKNANKADE